MAQNNSDLPSVSTTSPKFGRLLIVLFVAVMLIVLVTLASEAYYKP